MIKEGHTVEEIEKQVGDRAQGVRKNAIAYQMLQEAREESDWDITKAKQDFSLILLAIGQKNIKFYLGCRKKLPKNNDLKALNFDEMTLVISIQQSTLLYL